jgi:phosphatidylglycerophosphatase A
VLTPFFLQLATFFGIGRLKPAPGTWGSLAALPFAALLMKAGPFVYMGACVLLLPLAILSAEIYERVNGGHDHSEIVVDEVLGMWVALTWLPLTWQSFLAAFLLFRLLDITKPFPISYLDRRIEGGVGVVVDDVAAGLFVNIALQFVYQNTTWLGLQSFGGIG